MAEFSHPPRWAWIALGLSHGISIFSVQNTHNIISSNIVIGDDYLIANTNNKSVFRLNYHLVLVVKYRRKVIDDKISNRLKEIFEYISPKYNVIL